MFFVRASAFRAGEASSTDRENVKFFIDSTGSTVKLVSVLKRLSIDFRKLKSSKMLTELLKCLSVQVGNRVWEPSVVT